MKETKRLLLPCLTGKFGSWRYYNVVMKIRDVIDSASGIKTIPESKKIYKSDNLNEILQRLEDPKRIEPLKRYILDQKDRYFNSLTVAITGGDPKWHPVSIKKDSKFDEVEINYLNLKYGILELTGKEELFILDGQHRLLGLRDAYGENRKIGEEEVSIMLVIHEDTKEGIKKLRRIFVSLNRNAKLVSEGENIILEEDDVSAIVARQLVEQYDLFKNNNVIAFNKNLNLKVGKHDSEKFTSLLSLYNVNEYIVDNDAIYEYKINGKYVRIRPKDEIIKASYAKAEEFWNRFFKTFPEAKKFIEKPSESIPLRQESGGAYFMRPIGQEIVVKFYCLLRGIGKIEEFSRLQVVEKKLDSAFWKFVLYDPYKGSILMNSANALNYLLYNLGYDISKIAMRRLVNDYRKRSGDLKLPLPEPVHKSL